MKNALLLVVFCCSFSAFAQRPKPQQLPDRQKIISVLMRQKNAWNEGNLEAYMEGYWKNDSLMFIGKKGITRGWSATLDNYKKAYPDQTSMGTLAFDILSVELLSPVSAHVIGKWNLTRDTSKGDLSGHFTLIFKRINNRWVIVSDHSS